MWLKTAMELIVVSLEFWSVLRDKNADLKLTDVEEK